MRLGRFEVLDQIGEGGAGAVFRARAEGRLFAVKLLRRTDVASLQRFERERRLLDGLGEAEGFVPLVEAGSAPEGPWIAMPLLGGGTLRERIARRGRIPHEEAVPLVASVARAMGRAHELGIVHRDLKPENILFATDGKPLVSDLGLAKHYAREDARDSVSMSRTGDFRGTIGYVAPEQMLDAKAATPQVDVFALGAILFECLAGEPAVPGGSSLMVARASLAGTTRPLSALRPHAPRWLRRVVARALAASPARRFADAGALARALEEKHAPGPPAALVVAVLILVLLLVVGGGGLALARLARPAPPARGALAREALSRAEERERAEDDAGAAAELARALELAPDLEEAWTRRALLRARRHDAPGARSDAERALALAPRSVAAWCAAGAAREAARDHAGAIEAYSKAIELDGSHAPAWAGRALSRFGIDDPLTGLDAEKAIALAPGLPAGHVARALHRMAASEFPDALAESALALAAAPRSVLALAVHGCARVWTGDDGGRDECARAIELDALEPTAWAARAFSWVVAERPDLTIDDCTKALEADPGHVWALVWRSRSRHMSGDVPGALEDTARAKLTAPRSARPWNAEGDARLSDRDTQAALLCCQRALELDPDNVSTRMVRSMAFLSSGEFDRAAADCEDMVRLAPTASWAWYALGNVELVKHDLGPARTHAQRALDTARDVFRTRNARALLTEIERESEHR